MYRAVRCSVMRSSRLASKPAASGSTFMRSPLDVVFAFWRALTAPDAGNARRLESLLLGGGLHALERLAHPLDHEPLAIPAEDSRALHEADGQRDLARLVAILGELRAPVPVRLEAVPP